MSLNNFGKKLLDLVTVTTVKDTDFLVIQKNTDGDRFTRKIMWSTIKGILLPVGDVIIEISESYLATIDDDVIIATGTFPVSLPPVGSANKVLIIKSVLTGGNITVDPDGAETIEGAAAQVLTPGTGFTISPSSTGWEIVAV